MSFRAPILLVEITYIAEGLSKMTLVDLPFVLNKSNPFGS